MYLPAGRSGRLDLDVTAIDDRECVHAQTRAQVDLGRNLRAVSELHVALAPVSPPQCPAPPREVTPAVGPTGGDTLLSLTGQHFSGVTVTIAGIPAPTSQWISPTQIRATLPAHPGAFGFVPIVVRNPRWPRSDARRLVFLLRQPARLFAYGPIPNRQPPCGSDCGRHERRWRHGSSERQWAEHGVCCSATVRGSFELPDSLVTMANPGALVAGDF